MRANNVSTLLGKKRTRKAPKRRQRDRNYQSLKLCLENLEQRNLMTVATFQDGLGAYEGTQDTILYSITPSVNFGTETGMSVDQQDVGGVRQGLLKFGNIIGNGPGQIPVGSTINSATLTVQVFNDSNTAMQMSMYRMLQDWDQSVATWGSFGSVGGVNASEGEVEGLPPDAILFDSTTGTKTFNVTTSLRHWAAGESNFGWLIESAATNGWDFNTSEAALANRPVLTVDYTAPSGAGQFRFINLTPIHTEGDTGTTTAMLTVARVGGTSGQVSVDFDIAAGAGATVGVDFNADNPANDTLVFANGVSVQSIPVTIHGDTGLEGLETVIVSLTNAQGGATINAAADEATLTIADDDALINEVFANISNASNETNREYIELLGTPGASLTGYYFVVFESEEEENSGAGSGIADLVINLSGQTFGANGLLVITGTSWAYTKAAATNQLATALLDAAGGVLEDSSQTYALVRSTTPIVQGTDYDTIGAYENATQLAIGTGVGILDTGPFAPGGSAQIVDSVGVVEGGGNDRDRVATTVAAGHPGIHVHQPEGSFTGDNTTSDAVTRRAGQRAPNSIGVWYNGDIPNGTLPATYANGTTAVSVVTPAGAQITPGAPNILRNVAFAVTEISVDENAGTATLTVTRLGDSSQAITVNYNTVNGTALAGPLGTGDYQAIAAGVLNFAAGAANDNQNIVITIHPDSVAEGFESFNVNLTSATSPYQIITPTATVTISDADVQVTTFQDGASGYSGTADVFLNSAQPDDPFGFTFSITVDEEVGSFTGSDARPGQALLRFDDLFGAALGQVPMGSQIFSAFLTLNVNNPSSALSDIRLFRMLQGWDEGTSTWNDPLGNAGAGIFNGITPDDVEAAAVVDSIVTNPAGSGLINIPLNRDTIQAWANGTLSNLGWVIVSDSPDDWSFNSSDSLEAALKPKLTILYTAPTATEGTFGFAHTDYKVNESGGSATITVNRVGGSTGSADLTYTITPGTGSLADITGAATGPVHFNAGQLSATITIPIFNDTALERNETLNITLTPTSGEVIDHSTAVLTIRDNDFVPTSPTLLLSEIFINSPGNDGTHEFVELSGTASAGLGSLYVAIFNGDVGEGEGSTDLVVDLGTFLNGSNGHTIISALNNFGYRVPSGATQIGRPELDTEIVSNDSGTYALLYSPSGSLLTGRFDYDWDNDGSLELPSGVVIVDSLGIKDNGVLDQTYGPAANQIDSNDNPNDYVADAVSRKRGDTSRNSAAAWFHGDLLAAGDDGIVYDAPVHVTGLPAGIGTAMTPGETNTGTTAQSPLVRLTGITPNSPVGTVTLTFNGPVNQSLIGDGGIGFTGRGISITNPDGSPNGLVNMTPIVTGLGTNTLTLSFTGSGVSGGQLPIGNYRLNFVGNSLIGNGRAVDVDNDGVIDLNLDGAPADTFSFNFTQTSTAVPGDFDSDGDVDGADFVVWQTNFPTAIGATLADGDADGDGDVDGADFVVWQTNFPTTPGGGVPGNFDSDSDVDGADFVVWQTNFPTASGATLADGDADSDSDVDGADFVVWQTNFPTTPGGGVAEAESGAAAGGEESFAVALEEEAPPPVAAAAPVVLSFETFVTSPASPLELEILASSITLVAASVAESDFVEVEAPASRPAAASLFVGLFESRASFASGRLSARSDLHDRVWQSPEKLSKHSEIDWISSDRHEQTSRRSAAVDAIFTQLADDSQDDEIATTSRSNRSRRGLLRQM